MSLCFPNTHFSASSSPSPCGCPIRPFKLQGSQTQILFVQSWCGLPCQLMHPSPCALWLPHPPAEHPDACTSKTQPYHDDACTCADAPGSWGCPASETVSLLPLMLRWAAGMTHEKHQTGPITPAQSCTMAFPQHGWERHNPPSA